MKKYFFTAFMAAAAVALLASCASGNKDQKMVGGDAKTVKINSEDSTTWSTVEWIDTVYDFQTIETGPLVGASFRFKNTGTKPLVIESVQASCGCTEPEKPEQPIMPGDEGLVKAKFKSEGQNGPVEKTITVVTNTALRTYYLKIKGTVNPKKQS